MIDFFENAVTDEDFTSWRSDTEYYTYDISLDGIYFVNQNSKTKSTYSYTSYTSVSYARRNAVVAIYKVNYSVSKNSYLYDDENLENNSGSYYRYAYITDIEKEDISLDDYYMYDYVTAYYYINYKEEYVDQSTKEKIINKLETLFSSNLNEFK